MGLFPNPIDLRFSIEGEPQGKGRPRFGNGHAYTPEKTRQYEAIIQWSAKQAGAVIRDGAVFLEITAYFKLPLRTKLQPGSPALKKPDWDNIGKIFSDALQGIAYRDDTQVFPAVVTKLYAEHPRVDVLVRYADDL